MIIGKYKLEYTPKIERAIQAVGENDEQAILVEYDRLGGLITMNGEKVKRGSFFNAKAGKAHEKPQVVVMRKPRPAEEVAVEEEVVVDGELTEEDINKMTGAKLKELVAERGLEGIDVTVSVKDLKVAVIEALFPENE